MNELKPKTNNPTIQCIEGVRGYVDADGVVQLNLEDIARGLGFTTVATSGNVCVRWNRVYGHLVSCGFSQLVGKGGKLIPFKDCKLPEYIPEPIVYLLSMKAENKTALAFQRTIAYDILPAIRKHGAYMTPETIKAALTDPDTIILLATTLKDEQAKREALEAKVEADKPKVLFADAVDISDDSILIGELARLLRQNGVDIGQNRLFAWLRENGYLIRREGSDYNTPTQRSMDLGVLGFKERTVVDPDGGTHIRKTPKVTGKGQQYFINKFLGSPVEESII